MWNNVFITNQKVFHNRYIESSRVLMYSLSWFSLANMLFIHLNILWTFHQVFVHIHHKSEKIYNFIPHSNKINFLIIKHLLKQKPTRRWISIYPLSSYLIQNQIHQCLIELVFKLFLIKPIIQTINRLHGK